jgi:hypothetical protein
VAVVHTSVWEGGWGRSLSAPEWGLSLIHHHVWDWEWVRPGEIAIVYCLVYWGYRILHIVVRDYRLVNYGVADAPIITALPQANKELDPASRAAFEKALAAMEKWDQQAAIEVYREAGCTKQQAMVAVMNLGKKLQAERPNRFAYPPLSLSNMSWRGMLICGLVEAAALAVVLYQFPFYLRIEAVLPFAYCFLFGIGIMAFTRVKGFGKRILLLAPGVLAMLVSEIVLRSLRGEWRTLELYVIGGVFGMTLMAVGLAGEAGRAMRKKLGEREGASV